MEKESVNKKLNIILFIVLLVSLILNGIGLYYFTHPDTPEPIVITDTITIPKDSIITKTIYKTKFDTVLDVQYKDTIIRDTVRIPIEHKVDSFTLQKDSLTINQKIYHQGFHSIIDSVHIDYKWNYTPEPKKQKKIGLVWNVGPYIGYGINFNGGQYYFSPEVGIGASIGIGGIINNK